MESDHDARKGSPEARQKWRQEVSGDGIARQRRRCHQPGFPSDADPASHLTVGLDGAGALQELLPVECECDAVRMPVEQFSSEFGLKRLDCAVTAVRHVETAAAAETLPISAVAMKWRT